MSKLIAAEPPMGWNSYDYYNTLVNEKQVKANAEYMAKNLLKYGWEYVVVDIQWSDPDAGTMNDRKVQYVPFSNFCIDEYSRQIPAENRFPSAAGGKGFKPLADYIHSLGLKFGIHIMRGIPRHACHNHIAIKTHDGTKVCANQIANAYNTCAWNPDMYGVDYKNPYAQDYYDSLFELYAQWDVDFVKVDDICRHVNDVFYEEEVKMIAKAIENCGRDMVLSLSPGPALIEKSYLYDTYANMWRITDDFWDNWPLLKNMFERCEIWQKHTGEGSWPDCDMIPLNDLSFGWDDLRKSNFTDDEVKTMISLWCIFRSPLMVGTELTTLDEYSLKMITNEEILAMNKCKNQAWLAYKSERIIVWANKSDNGYYAAIFNVGEETEKIYLEELLKLSELPCGTLYDLWEKKEITESEISLNKHSSKVIEIK